MDEDEWEASANAHLDIRDDCDLDAHDAHCEPVEFYKELNERFEYARLAFPGMTVEQFIEIETARNQPPKMRGGQPKDPHVKAQEPKWRAAQDAGRLKEYWGSLHTGKRQTKPPLSPELIAATRHDVRGTNGDVDPEIVITAIRRPKDRRWDKK